MRASTLSVLFSTLLSLHQAGAGLVRTTDASNAQVGNFSDVVTALDSAVASSKTNGAVEVRSLHRRVDMQLQNLNALAHWLTRMPLRADCFFVTSARFLGTTVEDISNRAGLAVPPPGSRGISMSNMVTGLERLGLRFRVWTYHDEEPGPSRTPRGVPESQAYSPVGAPRVMGVAYRRPDGSGHVVIVRNAGRSYRHYVDYQASPGGVDVTRDVRRSSTFAYFAVDLEASSAPFVDQQRETVDRMNIEEELAHVNEPMDTDEYPGDEAPMDVDRDVVTGGVDLSTLQGEVLQRIRNSLLPQGECAALVALAMIQTSRHRRPRVMPGFAGNSTAVVHAKTIRVVARSEDKGARLQAMILKEKPAEVESNVIHNEIY